MAGDRVLSSGAAKQAITELRQLINDGLLDQIGKIGRQGQVLSEPNNWDGRLAGEFRSNWPAIQTKLEGVQRDLAALRDQVEKINQNIMNAGGNQ